MDRNQFMLGLLIVQILLFTIAILSKSREKKAVHYFILFILSSILFTHILAYNTDA
jgi:hypothetical protein